MKDKNSDISLSTKIEQFILTCIFGICNNTGYVVVTSLAHDMAHIYHKETILHSFGLVLQITCTLSTLFATLMAMFKVSMIVRFGIILVLNLSSQVGMYFCSLNKDPEFFFISLIFVMPAGIVCGLGEVLVLALVSENIGSENLGGWGLGTGLAGVLPMLILIQLNYIQFSIPDTFLVFMSVAFLQILTQIYFHINQINKPKSASLLIVENDGNNNKKDNGYANAKKYKIDTTSQDNLINLDNYKQSSNKTMFDIIICSWYQLINASTVFFMSYAVVQTLGEQQSNRFGNSSFVNLMIILMQQIGTTVGRTSLDIIKIQWLQIFTVISTLIFIACSMIISLKIEVDPVYFYILSIATGISGGFSQINTWYMIGKDEIFEDQEKEIVTNYCCFLNNAVVIASMFQGIVQNNIM